MKTADEIIEGLLECAVAAACDDKRITKFVLSRSDYERVLGHLQPIASSVPGFFTIATAAGVVRVEPSDKLPPGDAQIMIGLKRRTAPAL